MHCLLCCHHQYQCLQHHYCFAVEYQLILELHVFVPYLVLWFVDCNTIRNFWFRCRDFCRVCDFSIASILIGWRSLTLLVTSIVRLKQLSSSSYRPSIFCCFTIHYKNNVTNINAFFLLFFFAKDIIYSVFLLMQKLYSLYMNYFQIYSLFQHVS